MDILQPSNACLSISRRYSVPDHNQIESLSFEAVQAAVKSQLSPDALEVSISGDVPMQEMLALAMTYFGTIPPRPTKRSTERYSMEGNAIESE